MLASVTAGQHVDALAALHALLDDDRIVMATASAAAIQDAGLDQRLALLLSCVDGRSTVEAVIEASSLEIVEGLEALCELLDRRLVALR